MHMNPFKSSNKWADTNLWGALALVVIFYVITSWARQYGSEEQIVKRLQQDVYTEQEKLETCATSIESVLGVSPDKNYWPQLEREVQDDAYTYLQIYHRDSLIFWNSNQLSALPMNDDSSRNIIVRNNMGWYLLHYRKLEDYRIFVYKLIKTAYAINNPLLPPYQNVDFGGFYDLEFSLTPSSEQTSILNKEGMPILGIQVTNLGAFSHTLLYTLFVVFILIYVFLISWMSHLYEKIWSGFEHKAMLKLFLILDVMILRFVDVYFQFPAILKESFLFSEKLDIAPFFNSIGDLTLNIVLALVIVVRLRKSSNKDVLNNSGEPKRGLGNIAAHLLLLCSTVCSFGLVYYMVYQGNCDSILAMDLSKANCWLFVSTIILTAILQYNVVVSLSPFLKGKKYALYVHAAILLVLSLFFGLFVDVAYWFIGLVAGFDASVIFMALYVKDQQAVKIQSRLLYLVLFCSLLAVTINIALDQRRDTKQLSTLNLLANAKEPMLENSFDELSQELQQDTVLFQLLRNGKSINEEVDRYLKSAYFNGFWKKFNIQITVCDQNELIEIQPDGLIVGCNEYFNTIIESEGSPTASDQLYLIDKEPEHIYYIGKIAFRHPHIEAFHLSLFIDFVSSIIPEGLGYPELLIDEGSTNIDLSGYSFANYAGGRLDYKFGDLSYYTDYTYLSAYAEEEFFNLQGYRHIKIALSENNILILSRPQSELAEHLVIFSILFILFSALLLAAFVFTHLKDARSILTLNLGTRFQTVFILIISFIIVSMAVLTLFYAEINNVKRQRESLHEKTYSVFIELQHKLSGDPSIWSEDREMLQALLRKFSLVFFSDINLFDDQGYLVASSRPEVRTNGLISEFVNPMAYEELFVKNKLFYITEETIGSLRYLSSYKPLTLVGDKPVGIINLPYFARQSQEKASYYRMLFTFINLFVIFGIIGTFVALLFSRYLIKPLRVLEESIAAIQIDKKNKRIKWSTNDEIGQLIVAYNRMVDKLEQSAELIKHSERESAWREVARQIAHEIRNPLTPMKLNVQYLEKAYNEQDVHFDQKIKSISRSLIQQIDSLDKVAEMFSDFAKMNERKFHKVDLLQLIKSVVSLFENQSDVNIDFTYDKEVQNWSTLAFEKDLIRVFNNLIKNAMQASDEDKLHKISIQILKEDTYYTVRISDTGKGIAEEAKTKIFQPYFTTKSGGTGLGLAIVKNIINEVGGDIGFESKKGQGTTFVLKFKVLG